MSLEKHAHVSAAELEFLVRVMADCCHNCVLHALLWLRRPLLDAQAEDTLVDILPRFTHASFRFISVSLCVFLKIYAKNKCVHCGLLCDCSRVLLLGHIWPVQTGKPSRGAAVACRAP